MVTFAPDFPPGAQRIVTVFEETAGNFPPEDVVLAAINVAAMVIGRVAKTHQLSRMETLEYMDEILGFVRDSVIENIDRLPRASDVPLTPTN